MITNWLLFFIYIIIALAILISIRFRIEKIGLITIATFIVGLLIRAVHGTLYFLSGYGFDIAHTVSALSYGMIYLVLYSYVCDMLQIAELLKANHC